MDIGRNRGVRKGVGHFECKFQVEWGVAHQRLFVSANFWYYYLYMPPSQLCLVFYGQKLVWIFLPFCTCLIAYTVVFVLLLWVANK